MKGYQVSFLTVQGHRHGAQPGGRHRRIHSAHFFELADQPVEVVMAVTEDESARLFERLQAEGVHLFYVKAPVEFGEIGTP